MYKILIEGQSIAKQYVNPLSLDVVRGQQVSDSVQSLGAHMNLNYIDQNTFRKWMCTTREGRQLASKLPWEPNEMEGLPFLVAEGTGLYEPYGVDLPNASIMGYVYQCSSLEGFKKGITRKKGQTGNFFLGSLVGLTDFFHKRGATTPHSFWYVTNSKRGASYDDMMNQSERVGAKIHSTLEKPLMDKVNEAILRRLPPYPLILSPLAKDAKRHHNSVLEHVCKSINGLKRPNGNVHMKVAVYIRPHQLTREIGIQMTSEFTRLNRIWKVEYKLEEITDLIFGYKMDVYVN